MASSSGFGPAAATVHVQYTGDPHHARHVEGRRAQKCDAGVCRSSTWQEKLSALVDSTLVCQCRDSTGMVKDYVTPQVTQSGRSNRRVTGREVLTDHQHRAQRTLETFSRVHTNDSRLGGTFGSIRRSSGWASPDLWTAT